MTVTLLTSQSAPQATEADVLLIGVFAEDEGPVPVLDTDEIDLRAALTTLGATGKAEEITKIPAGGRLAAPVVVAVGLGPRPGGTEQERQAYLERLRRAAGAAARELTASSGATRRIAIALPADEADEAEAVALGALLGGYSFRRYRTSAAPAGAVEQILHTAQDAAADRARILAEAITLVRDLVNTPPADLVPADLAAVAERTASGHGLGVRVLDENELAKEGFGGILAVGMGSSHPPRLVRLEYTHPGAGRTVAFAGKGITFDSGGLSLKPPKAMLPAAGREHAGRRRAAPVRRHHDLRRQDRGGAEHRRGGPPGAGRRAGPLRGRHAQPAH
jgi:leucyl aminopeptidase